MSGYISLQINSLTIQPGATLEPTKGPKQNINNNTWLWPKPRHYLFTIGKAEVAKSSEKLECSESTKHLFRPRVRKMDKINNVYEFDSTDVRRIRNNLSRYIINTYRIKKNDLQC